MNPCKSSGAETGGALCRFFSVVKTVFSPFSVLPGKSATDFFIAPFLILKQLAVS